METALFDTSKNFVKSNLLEGEEIVYSARLHWYVFIKPIFYLLLAITFPLIYFNIVYFPGFLRAVVSIILIISASIYLIYIILAFKTTEIYITNKRVAWKRGIIGRVTFDISIKMIECVLFRQSLLARIFNSGDLFITGVGAIISRFRSIEDPLEFRNMIIKQIL